MQPLKEAQIIDPSPEEKRKLMAMAKKNGIPITDIEDAIARAHGDSSWMNDTYTVIVHNLDEFMTHLSIRRNDRAPVTDWRDKQAIKNQLVGPECEAVELYPAESRLVDSANQYHLFCVTDPEFRFPFGFKQRLVANHEEGTGAKQRDHSEETKLTTE